MSVDSSKMRWKDPVLEKMLQTYALKMQILGLSVWFKGLDYFDNMRVLYKGISATRKDT